jgi:pimeloyl-ACP methyl ester carboxylesterase
MEPPPLLRPYAHTRDVGGMRLHYYDAGAGAAPPLVLIHGLGDEADTWRHIFLPLAERRRVIALDLPGFGRSDKPYRHYTVTFFARAVWALLAALDLDQVVLMGSSLGAFVCQRLAIARPAAVAQLVLIGGAMAIRPAGQPAPTPAPAPASTPAHTTRRSPVRLWLYLTPVVGELLYTGLRRSQDLAYASLRPYYHDLTGLPAADRAFLRERVWARVWSSGQRRAFLSTQRWAGIELSLRMPAWRERLQQLATPTLLIWGEHDAVVPRARGEAMAAALPNAELRIIAGSGHLPQQERPAALLDVLQALPT